MEEISHLLLFLGMEAIQIHLLWHCSADNIFIYILFTLYLVVWTYGSHVILLGILLAIIQIQLWMYLPTLNIFGVTIYITMVTMIVCILALMCNGCFPLVLSFPLLLSLLGIILVVFLLGTTCFSFILTHIFQILCLHISIFNCSMFKQHQMPP